MRQPLLYPYLFLLKNNGVIICKTASRRQAIQAAQERLKPHAKNVIIEHHYKNNFFTREVLNQWPQTKRKRTKPNAKKS